MAAAQTPSSRGERAQSEWGGSRNEFLVYNAADALKDRGGKVIITVRDFEGAVEICVRDNGPGIPDDIKSGLCEARKHLDTAPSKLHFQ